MKKSKKVQATLSFECLPLEQLSAINWFAHNAAKMDPGARFVTFSSAGSRVICIVATVSHPAPQIYVLLEDNQTWMCKEGFENKYGEKVFS